MLKQISPRQKARGVIGILGLSDDEKAGADALVDTVMGSPLAGAIIGVDARTLEELLGLFFDENIENSEMFSMAQAKLCDPKFRKVVASGIVRVLNTMSTENQKHAASLITRLSQMDIPEFAKDFDNIEDFMSEGLLLVASQENEPKASTGDICVCPHCGEGFFA